MGYFKVLKNITILKDDYTYMYKDYAISFMDPSTLHRLLVDINNEMGTRGYYNEENVIDIMTIKILCFKIKKPSIFVSFTFDDSVNPENYYSPLHKFLDASVKFIEKANNSGDLTDEEKKELEDECNPIIRDLLTMRPPKISIIGNDYVGKTSICSLLKNGTIPEKYMETTFMEKYTTELFGVPVLLWDIPDPGDLNNENMWAKFIMGSDAVILVLDSTQKNAIESKSMISMTDKYIPHAELMIIANKQDKDGALKPKELENILLQKVFPFVATEPDCAYVIQQQAAELLEIKSEHLDYTDVSFVIQRND